MSVKGFVRAEFKQNAKEKLNGHWTTAIAVTLFFLVVVAIYTIAQMVINYKMSMLGDITDPRILAQAFGSAIAQPSLLILIGAILSCAIQLASSKYFLNVVSNSPEVGLGDFLGYFRYTLKAIGAGLWQSLWVSLWSMIFMVPAIIAWVVGFGILVSYSIGVSESTSMGIIAIGIGVVLYILALVVTIIKTISYSQMYFVLANEDSIGVLRSMRISKVLTKNYLGDLFILDLSFILWHLLAGITAGLAYLYVFPYMTATFAETYLFLRNRAFEEGNLDPEEFGLRKVGDQAPGVGMGVQGTFPTEAPTSLPHAEDQAFHQEVEISPASESDERHE